MTYIVRLPKKLVKNAKAKMMNNIKNKRFKPSVFFIRYPPYLENKDNIHAYFYHNLSSLYM